jgi:ribulose 1,5-bisphosphate synthetase/thiazole synthase
VKQDVNVSVLVLHLEGIPEIKEVRIVSVRLSDRFIMERAREVKVCKEADVVVVGGGAAGIAAAVAAARS